MEIDAERRTPTLDLLRLSNGGTNDVILSSGGDSSSTTVWEKCRRMIYVRSNPKTGVPGGHWPIPESFWPDQNTQTLVSADGGRQEEEEEQSIILFLSGSEVSSSRYSFLV